MTITTFSTLLKLYLLLGVAAADDDAEINKGCAGPGIDTLGWTFPRGDVVLEAGTSLTITCQLNLNHSLTIGHTADDIVFRNGSRRIDRENVEVINSTAARLHLDNLNISSNMFYCLLVTRNGSATSSVSPSERLICLNSVVVGSKPKDVNNFECISYNWETLNCTWREPYNGVRTRYSIYYRITQRAGRNVGFTCPRYEEGKCGWTLETSPSYRRSFEYLLFVMEGVNVFGNNSQQFKINNYANMIPSAPRSLTVVNETTSSICLQWNIGTLQFFDKGLDYKIEYGYDSLFSNVITYDRKDVEKEGDLVRINVKDLKYPNTLYDFRVYMKSAVAVDKWSPAARLVAETKPCAPYRSPETDVGSFEIHRRNANSRHVYVYWKQIPMEERNGDDFRYEVTVLEDDREIDVKSFSITDSYAKFYDLTYIEYKFIVKSVNSEGYAPYSTTVYLPREEDVVPEVAFFDKVDYGNGAYKLSWNASNDTGEVQNFTIFWCEIRREWSRQCDGVLDWMHLPGNTTKLNFTAKTDTDYQFAVSVNSMNSSSGMVWATCTVLRDKVNKMKNIWLGKSGSTFIEVKWILECSERVEGIKGFNITYCPVSTSGKKECESSVSWIVEYGDSMTSNANVTRLKPFTYYKISIAMFTDRLNGPFSEPIYGRTDEAAPEINGIDIDVRNITDRSAIVVWNAPTVRNGIINHYEVHYNQYVVIVNDTSVELTDLKSYTWYSIVIYVCTTFCARTNPIALHTKIGIPGEMVKPNVKMINSTIYKLKWDPPEVLAGPSPVYEVKMQYDESTRDSVDRYFETTDTEIVVKEICEPDSPELYTFYIRAKNTDYSNRNNMRELVGPWSSGYTVDCTLNAPSVGTHFVLITSCGMIIFSVIILIFRKKFNKCKTMKRMKIVVPAQFTVENPTYQKRPDDDFDAELIHSLKSAKLRYADKISNSPYADQAIKSDGVMPNCNISPVNFNEIENASDQNGDNPDTEPKSAVLRIKTDSVENPAYLHHSKICSDKNHGDVEFALPPRTAVLNVGNVENPAYQPYTQTYPDDFKTELALRQKFNSREVENPARHCVAKNPIIKIFDKIRNRNDQPTESALFSPQSTTFQIKYANSVETQPYRPLREDDLK